MIEQKALPAIMKMRAERILKLSILAVYRVEENNPNLVKCIMAVGQPRYIDLVTKKEVSVLNIQIVDDVQKDDTNLLVGKDAAFDYSSPIDEEASLKLRDNSLPADAIKQTRKSTVKKTKKSK